MEKPRITEIKVRMDCNGCVQKIKKALHGINGIYDLYIDFPQQKITIIGWADTQKIAKALKKTRKTAVICSHTEPADHDQPSEPATADGEAPPAAADRGSPPAPATEGGGGGGGPPPAPESTSQPPAEAEPESESPKEPPPRPPENPPISEAATSAPPNQPQVQTSRPKDIEEIHVIHHHAPERYGPYSQRNPPGGGPPPGLVRVEQPQPTYVTTHSHNAYRPSPHVPEYAYINRPLPPTYPQYYTRPIDQYYTYSNEEHRAGSSGNITSVFSDENPNACTIA